MWRTFQEFKQGWYKNSEMENLDDSEMAKNIFFPVNLKF
jgi:hypothetical protein